MKNKKTAMKLLISHFEKLARVSDDIDQEQAFCFRWAAQIAKYYIAKETKQIEDSFVECWKSNVPDGIECKLSAKEYYKNTYGK